MEERRKREETTEKEGESGESTTRRTDRESKNEVGAKLT
jgi:hypothetical protein